MKCIIVNLLDLTAGACFGVCVSQLGQPCGNTFKECRTVVQEQILKKKKKVVVFTSIKEKQLLCLLQTGSISQGLKWSQWVWRGACSMLLIFILAEGELQHYPHSSDCSFYSSVACSSKHRANVLLSTKWCLVWWEEKIWMFPAFWSSSQGHENLDLPRLEDHSATVKQAKLVHSGELSDRVWCRKWNWDVVRAENWKSGPLLGKLLSYDLLCGTTEIIVADNFTRNCENVIRLESLLQMKRWRAW